MSNKARIGAVDAQYDFGFLPVGFTVVHYFQVYNDGGSDLIIDKLVPNCDCTIAIPNDTLVSPGDTTEIKIHFSTENYYGPTNRHVAVHTNDPEKPVIYLEYSSNIGFYPRLFEVTPKSLFFLPGHDAKEIQLINNYKDKTKFSIELETDSVFTVDRVKGDLQPGKPVSINIKPHPGLSKGTHQSNLSIIYKFEKTIKITVPIKIARF